LHENNYKVFLIGRASENELAFSRPYKTKRIKTHFNKGFLGLAEWQIRLFFVLLFSKKDILLANDLDTLLANYVASLFSKTKLVYDTHELFTEIPELIHRPRTQKFWLRIEQFIFPKLKNIYTVCDAIAQYYTDLYNVPVAVIRNLPFTKNNKELGEFSFEIGSKKILFYQGALNKGRGLELIIDTMPLLENWIFIIAGDGTISENLQQRVKAKNLTEQVYFLGRLLPEELAKLTPLASVGISVEEDMGLSYHYALPNKIFDYIHAQIPILVSDLPEMNAVINKYKVGQVVMERESENIAKQVEEIAKTTKETWDFDTAIKDLNWQKESGKLLQIYSNLR
jgi:glycosyltransferase involved in cell wall biosynthesis